MHQSTFQNQVAPQFIKHGKPTRKAATETFSEKVQKECLNQNWFVDLRHRWEAIKG